MRSQAQLEQYAGHRLVVDLASFKLKAWYSDVAHYYRPTEPQTHGCRGVLARLLSALSLAGYRVDQQCDGLPGRRPLPAEEPRALAT